MSIPRVGLYDELATRLEQAERERDELQQQLNYIRELAANPHLSAAQKWTMWAIREKLDRTVREGEQLTEINVYEIGQEIGMSRQSAGDCIKSLANTGAIARKQIYDVAEGKQGGRKTYKKRILVGLTLFSNKPKEIVPASPRNHGGKRERCERCGGENLEIYEAYICKDCGHIHQAQLKKETKGRKGFLPKSQLDS